ncbi:MAG: STAS domain-containing protein [Cyanobacteria bacterium CRU_2_1]|nr:STAS domain-containing protein [Cyanobacteria bacterium RU_5_0]NJR58220.1 STAS domain-containing protein [Cyanobacteria bacterium CRU_2_1]
MQSTLAQSNMTIVQPNGHINVANAAVLKQQLAETVSSHEYSSLLVDMSQVESLDSAGLMVFVSTLTLAQRLNKQFGLFGISPSVRIIFELTQLDRIFEIFDTHPTIEAVAA